MAVVMAVTMARKWVRDGTRYLQICSELAIVTNHFSMATSACFECYQPVFRCYQRLTDCNQDLIPQIVEPTAHFQILRFTRSIPYAVISYANNS